MKLRHLYGPAMHASGLFRDVGSFEHFTRQLAVFAGPNARSYGAGFEVFAEFFLRRCGKYIDIKNVRGTSVDTGHRGIDFYARRPDGSNVAIQVKYRGENSKRGIDLTTFHDECGRLRIPSRNRLLMTNGAIGSHTLAPIIASDRGFWKAFAKSLEAGPAPLPKAREVSAQQKRVAGKPSRVKKTMKDFTQFAHLLDENPVAAATVFYGGLLAALGATK